MTIKPAHIVLGAVGHHSGGHVPLADGHLPRNEVKDAQGNQPGDQEQTGAESHRGGALNTGLVIIWTAFDPT